MEITNSNDAIVRALEGALHNRLVLIAGAGLSMAPPSNLPSAAQIAKRAKAEYDARYGGVLPPLAPGIEDQAQFFYKKGELGVYLNEYVDQHAFAGEPNPGHFAVADLLLSNALRAVVTTNVDILIEGAGLYLLGQIFVGVDGLQVAAAPVGNAPMLKLHGCWTRERDQTVWAPDQLHGPPVQERIERSATWLKTALVDKDLLIVGYSTDWDYLNEVIALTLGAVAPASVLLVDPSTTADFVAKAPELAALAAKAQKGAFHLQASGSEFLERVRLSFSKAFIRRVVAMSVAEFEARMGRAPAPVLTDAPEIDNDSLWRMRRDLLGCKPGQPARTGTPPAEPAVGLTILEIREAGGTPLGSYWNVGGRSVRVIRAANTFLHAIEYEYRRDMPPASAPDIVVAVGAEDVFLPANIARTSERSIARGAGPTWMTRAQFEATL